MTSHLTMLERELHIWIDYDVQGMRRVRVEAREPKAIRGLLKDKRFHLQHQTPESVTGHWTGGAFPWKTLFPPHFRGKGVQDESKYLPKEFVREEARSGLPGRANAR